MKSENQNANFCSRRLLISVDIAELPWKNIITFPLPAHCRSRAARLTPMPPHQTDIGPPTLLLLVMMVEQGGAGDPPSGCSDGGRAETQEFCLVVDGGGWADRYADRQLALGGALKDAP